MWEVVHPIAALGFPAYSAACEKGKALHEGKTKHITKPNDDMMALLIDPNELSREHNNTRLVCQTALSPRQRGIFNAYKQRQIEGRRKI
jgi:hypothetical protein